MIATDERGGHLRDEAQERLEAEFARAANEDDDGYDPWSDRRPVREPLFEEDPWR